LRVTLTVLKSLQISNLTFDRRADYLPRVTLGSNANRQKITTNINSNRRADYLPGVTLGSNADRQEITININSDKE
jgi:outer membrane protein TolC